MFFNFWRISAYFRRSCFCSRRLSVFEHGAKIQSDFCPTLFSFSSPMCIFTHEIVHSSTIYS
ncbi:hypothetical protein EZ054_09170 [Enterococcus faecalis]|nr:hypothetical protein [Enterococcus faecalis]MUN83038.1 hypothetical protein [Enterococcus faecalis]TQA89770.1 hypothetical protein FKZ05_07415 [Enterococcus faecalis]